LGKGRQDFLGIDLHTFPAARDARTIWQNTATGEVEISQPAYRDLLADVGTDAAPCALRAAASAHRLSVRSPPLSW
jgi:hypothetical protein